MTRLFLLSGSVIEKCSDFGHFTLAAKTTPELKRMADKADTRRDLPGYGKRIREISKTYQKRARGAKHKGGRRR